MLRSARAATTTLLATLAGAAHADPASVATARKLAIEGIEAVEAGDCAKGEPLLDRAEKLHHASVHLQYVARCKAKDGHLVAATELWRRIVRDGAPAGSSPAVRAAVTEATSSLDATLPRLASTTLVCPHPRPGLELSLDGAAIPVELVGVPQVVDPGHHELVARAPGYQDLHREWTVREGGAAEVTIELARAPTEAPPAPPPGARPPATDERPDGAGPLVTAGWVTGSVGVAALIGGTVTWLARNSRREDFYSHCPDRDCRGYYSQADFDGVTGTIRDLTTATNVLMLGGSALILGGATLVVIGSSKREQSGAALIPGAPRAAAGLSLTGRF